MGNILSKNEIQRIGLKSHGGSTLGGRKVWFDHDVSRLNYDERGEYLGEFHSEDLILVILKSGEFYTTNFDVNNHYEPGILRIEKFSPDKIWCAVLYDADQQGYPYVKRFAFEPSTKPQSFMGENKDSRFVLLTDEAYPRLQITFGGHDSFRDPQEIDAESFIGVKSFKAKGKRLTTFDTEAITELEPIRRPEPETEEAVAEETEEKDTEKENLDPDAGKSQSDIMDELTGQMKLLKTNNMSHLLPAYTTVSFQMSRSVRGRALIFLLAIGTFLGTRPCQAQDAASLPETAIRHTPHSSARDVQAYTKLICLPPLIPGLT